MSHDLPAPSEVPPAGAAAHPSFATKGDLTRGDIDQHLVRMTWPMVWGMLAVISVQLADTYFISLMGDTAMLAGISFTFPVTMLISHLVFGVNIALSSVVSRLIGAKLFIDMKRVVLHGILMAMSVSAVIAGLTYVFLEPIFRLLGADDTTLPAIYEYMPLWLAASVVLALPVNANSAMRAAGDTLKPALIMSLIALINFILDPIMIFGWFGFPAMGVEGAALATLIAYVIGAGVAVRVLTRRGDLVATDGWHFDKFKDSLRRLGVIALPAGLANIIQPATSAIIVAVLAGAGPAAVAAYGIATRVEAFAMLLVIAMAVGMGPIIGQNWGARLFSRAERTIERAVLFNLIYSAFVAVILFLAADSIGGWFSQDPEVLHASALFFMMVPISYGLGNLVFGWSSSFNAMGKPRHAFVMIFVKCFIITVPFVLIGSALGGVWGVFAGIVLANILGGAMFHVIAKRSLREFEKELSAE
jgi:putative MATE family efflux protein